MTTGTDLALAPHACQPAAVRTSIPVLVFVCLLTFVHYTSAQMRGPVLPLDASGHGATPTGVGLIMGLHMAMAATGSIPLGRASDLRGRRPLLLGGMAVGVATSLLLPLKEVLRAAPPGNPFPRHVDKGRCRAGWRSARSAAS